jgi:hypothetical protein
MALINEEIGKVRFSTQLTGKPTNQDLRFTSHPRGWAQPPRGQGISGYLRSSINIEVRCECGCDSQLPFCDRTIGAYSAASEGITLANIRSMGSEPLYQAV